MRTQILVAVAFLTVALAGCSDDPPAGEVSAGSAAVPAEGSLALDTQNFRAGVDDPSGGANPAYEPCPFDGVPVPDEPAPDPAAEYRCQFGYTDLTVHMMSLPDPAGRSYAAFLVDTTGSEAEIALGELSANGTEPNLMYEVSWNNRAECASRVPADASNDPCNRANTHDAVEVRLGDVPVATAGLSDNAAFESHPAVRGTSFSLQYAGKAVTLELSGANATLRYEAVFYTADEAGAITAQETHAVSAGTNEFSTDANVNTFAEVHIHVAGTMVNVSQATV